MMTAEAPKRSIFRDQAVQKYRQVQEKSVLPRIVAPPVFLFFWILLVILTAGGIVAWMGQVPLYITGSGVILDRDVVPGQGSDEAVAVVPFDANDVSHIHRGLSSEVQIGSIGREFTRPVDTVSSALLSPSEIHQRYGLEMADPARIISIRLGGAISKHIYAGSPVHVQIQVGSRRLLSLFPVLGSLWRGV